MVILHLGNIGFGDGDTAAVDPDDGSLCEAARLLGCEAAHLGAAFANGRSELERAAEADEKLRKGLPIFFGSMGAFLLLACVTFCRVRRRGGRKAPPRLEFSAVPCE